MNASSQHTHNPSNPFNLINRDQEHLRLLSLYHYLVAGINALTLIFFVILPLLIGPQYYQGVSGKLPGSPMAIQQILIASLIIRGLMTFIIAMNGWALQQKRYWLTSVILSILECMALVITRDPLGPLLGISAILALRRESTKALFQAQNQQNAEMH